MTTGTLLKMEGKLQNLPGKNSSLVHYHLPLRQREREEEKEKSSARPHFLPMNSLLGKKISLHFTGKIFDLFDQKPIKKSYGQGYSYKNFISLARCDSCMVKPQLCHYHKGTCREPKWGEENCLIPHYVYLSITSGVKIGITRHTQIPTRWIDQGAEFALPILKVSDRKISGIIESEISKNMPDKTNWRKMIRGEFERIDLKNIRDQIYDEYGDLLDDADAQDLEQEVLQLQYPLIHIPQKFSSLSFDKEELIEGTLLGIKGQYLILDKGVLNMRKHQGYEVRFSSQ